jgi:pSer/pThr/pTyr-binding forkhead associated (FHA) protein
VQSGHPRLTLRTGSEETSTTVSPATAGRAVACDLQLPKTDTISREHALFTCEDGRWWVENVGRNGLCLNGRPLGGRHPLADRDELRWGTRADATVSTVLLATARPDPEHPEQPEYGSAQW